MRASKTLSNTLLMICEGENSEPNYFAKLAAIAKDKGLYRHIDIYPRPKNPDEEEEPVVKASSRPRRQFRSVAQVVPERTVELADDTEKPFMTMNGGMESWATPVRYIKEARDRIKTEEFDEIWTIFDKDGHGGHDKAFQLAAIDDLGKTVNIAFSSISFEHWVLLHFEKNNYPFVKSECKENKKSISCGTNSHTDDCFGATCVTGLLITNGYLPTYTKRASSDLYAEIGHLTPVAIENAAWLRMTQRTVLSTDNLWNINPITTVDNLVKRLLDIPNEIIWTVLGLAIKIGSTSFEMSVINSNLNLKITNDSDQNFTTNQIAIILNGQDGHAFRHEPPTLIAGGGFLNWQIGEINGISQVKIRFGQNVIML